MSSESAPLLQTEVAGEEDHVDHSSSGKKWIKPSPAWMLALVAVASISTSGTVAPRVEIYTLIICRALGHDSDGSASCFSQLDVQAATAKFIAIVAGLSGFLSTITAAWWGALSDCYGRIGVLSFNVAGLMLSDLSFLITARFWEMLPGTYLWFALGPIIEGLVGGISVAAIVMHAYISDCSNAADRSRAFSQLMGILFVGMSVGPLLTGYIIEKTGQVLPIFYVTTAIDSLVSLAAWFIIPESLSAAEMKKYQKRREERLSSLGSGVLGWLKKAASALDFVSPLAVLLPRRMERADGKRSTDWSMTILGLAYGFGVFTQGCLVSKIQYAGVVFGWTSGVLNYWLGAYHIAKAAYLTILFPVFVKFLTWLLKRRRATNSESGRLLSDMPTVSRKKVAPGASMDLLLARTAVVSDLIFYALIFSTDSSLRFAVFTMCIAFGTSFGPTMQSLALDLYARRGRHDTGSLLGAMTVVSALSSHILAPTLFGFTFAKTVATLPGAFLLVGCAALLVSLVLLMGIRLRKEDYGGDHSVDDHDQSPQS